MNNLWLIPVAIIGVLMLSSLIATLATLVLAFRQEFEPLEPKGDIGKKDTKNTN